MKKLYIHAGLPKTGTSFLQASLNYFEKKKLNKNFHYPIQNIKNYKIPTSGNGVVIFDLLILKDKSSLKRVIKDMFKHNKNVFISSETLSNLKREHIVLLKDILNELCVIPISIFFLRDLYEMYLSGYSQTVKRGGESRSFLDNAIERECLLDRPFLFKELGDVLVFKYCKNKDNFQNLFNFINLQTGSFKDFKIKKINNALNMTQIRFFRILNKFLSPTLVSYFADRISIYNKSHEKIIDKEVIKFLKDNYSRDINNINSEFMIDLRII